MEGIAFSIMQYNVSFENEGPGIGLFEFGAAKAWQNNIVRYNLSVNDAHTTKGGLRIWKAEGKGEMHDCEIFNNTIYSGNPGNRDLAGNRIPAGPAFDIGALEYIK
jgi:hypothetical protein